MDCDLIQETRMGPKGKGALYRIIFRHKIYMKDFDIKVFSLHSCGHVQNPHIRLLLDVTR
jgi:hypothetical protein